MEYYPALKRITLCNLQQMNAPRNNHPEKLSSSIGD